MDDAFGDEAFPVSSPLTIQTASGAAQNLDDDLTEEEKVICATAAEHQDQLKQEVHNRMMAEAGAKNDRKTVGSTTLQQWSNERDGQISLRKQNNQSMESQFMTKREDERSGNNPWERVTDNCDLSMQGVIAGGHDKTRMKHAMLNRKADLAAGETVVSGSFRTNLPG